MSTFSNQSKKNTIIFCCFLIIFIGNNNLMECVEISDSLTTSHLQLFHSPTSFSQSFDFYVAGSTGYGNLFSGDGKYPLCLDIHLDLTKNRDIALDDLINYYVQNFSLSSHHQIDSPSLFDQEKFTNFSSSPISLLKLAYTIRAVQLLI